MNYIKSVVIILVVSFMFPLLSFAELNNAKNEETQTLTFEIVSQNGNSDNTSGQSLLPKTGEKEEQLLLKGIGLMSTILIVSVLLNKRGNQYD